MEQIMKKVGMKVSIFMGISLSFCLSLVGNLLSGKFSFPMFLISFAASTLISLVIGFLVPMKKVGDAVTKGMERGSVKARLVESAVSDLIYTPVITLCMVALVRAVVPKMAPVPVSFPPFPLMFVKSLVICLVVAFALIYLLQPVFLKAAMKKYGVGGPGGPGAGHPPVQGDK
ncbi:MAG: hypothetical protein K6E92_04300 [Lachnospiraceae bacterium]|nr:hypothetical protein [Lachnospiraceae bacterium]